ncbi:MAG TPA: GspH/FimT family pseudopilin [Gemmatimonas sp.]|uniref:GspH/FimT family pseudopilin n=1 Tax=Gemmatimonas sp. TaxID=1962908 RepID=UPI002ED9E332
MFHRRRGSTTVEQLVVLTILAISAGIAIIGGGPVLDAAAVEASAQETATLFALARDQALAGGVATAVRIDRPTQRILVHVARDTLAIASFASSRVTLDATRDSMAYHPSGLGAGAANLRVTLTRGRRADTITVSRLGRVSR